MVDAMRDRPAQLQIYRTALPMRAFEHAAATRKVAEAIVVRLRTEGGRVGWGETLPRPYVTGETLESVREDLERLFWPRLQDAGDADQLGRAVADLPCRHDGRVVTAARCAMELAAVGALDIPWWQGPGEEDTGEENTGAPATGRRDRPTVTGVLGSADPKKAARKLRLMRWYGLRSFKLKLGFDDSTDRANLATVTRQLARGLATGKYDLRVDVNGGWARDDVPGRVAELATHGVCAVEQPCAATAGVLAELAGRCELPLIADESLITADDADVLLAAAPKVWLNIRIAKNGGLGPALRLARLARRHGVPYVLGCMVGESGILSTAQRALLGAAPAPHRVEGNYGRFLLRSDLTARSPRFGYGGRLTPVDRFAPSVSDRQLERHGRLVATLR